MDETHELLAYLMAALVILHVAAALKHHFVDRDDVFVRMLPRFMEKAMLALRRRVVGLCLLAGVFSLLGGASAHAGTWGVDYARSHLRFSCAQGDTPFEGEFKTFQAMIDLDPRHPETGKIEAVIDMSSASAGSPDRDGFLPQADWLDSSRFPQARFQSTAIHTMASGTDGKAAYVADGSLTIKGITRPVTLSFALEPDGTATRAQGHVALMRTDFNIGAGTWSSEAYVRRAVDVSFDIVAKPTP